MTKAELEKYKNVLREDCGAEAKSPVTLDYNIIVVSGSNREWEDSADYRVPFDLVGSLDTCCGVEEIGNWHNKVNLVDEACFFIWLNEQENGILLTSTIKFQTKIVKWLKKANFTGTVAFNSNSGNNITLWTKVLTAPKRGR